MGTVVDLQTYRNRRLARTLDPVERVRLAVERFAPVVRVLNGRPLAAAEREIGEVKALVERGLMTEAAERAESLAGRLERAGA